MNTNLAECPVSPVQIELSPIPQVAVHVTCRNRGVVYGLYDISSMFDVIVGVTVLGMIFQDEKREEAARRTLHRLQSLRPAMGGQGRFWGRERKLPDYECECYEFELDPRFWLPDGCVEIIRGVKIHYIWKPVFVGK